jgi:hypothetical protein
MTGPEKGARVGILSSSVAPSPEEAAKYTLFTSLTELAWVAGQNIVFEERLAAGQADRASRAGGRPSST